MGVLGDYHSINPLNRNFLAFLDKWFNSSSVAKISQTKGGGEITRRWSVSMIEVRVDRCDGQLQKRKSANVPIPHYLITFYYFGMDELLLDRNVVFCIEVCLSATRFYHRFTFALCSHTKLNTSKASRCKDIVYSEPRKEKPV